MTTPPLPSLDDIQTAVEDAGQLALDLGPRNPTRKPDGTWVTEADLAVSKLLKGTLAEVCPEAEYLDEEQGGRIGDGLGWVVDPIDGTTNFKRGDDRWCVSVALMYQGVPCIGMIHQPSLGRTWAAGPAEARFTVDGPGDVGILIGGRLPRSAPRWFRMWKATRSFRSTRMTGSAALDLVDVARGRAERTMAFGLSLWDYAAGWLLVERAGGRLQRWQVGTGWDLLVTHAGGDESP
jgi:myo-inositol-1(or 4)-monophosphatase